LDLNGIAALIRISM